MFNYEMPCSDWEERIKPAIINDKVLEICTNIANRRDENSFPAIFQHLYDYIDDNLEKFIDIY